MSERYFVTGVQLGCLIALPDEEARKKLSEEIIEKQFLGDKETFEEKFKNQSYDKSMKEKDE